MKFLNNYNFDENSNDDLDLRKYLNIFLRNKRFIGFFSISFFLVSCIFSLAVKKTWQGEFEIVLDQKNLGSTSSLLNSLGIKKNNLPSEVSQSIETQIGILKSPSVLLPIINFVELQESRKVDFEKWKENNLKVDLLKKTSILKISYKTKVKDAILPVLNKISKSYQEYSVINKNKNLKFTKDFLITQIDEYNSKSAKSIFNAQQYAIEKDLNIIETLNNNRSQFTGAFGSFRDGINFENMETLNPSKSSINLENINLESVRIKASNMLKNINTKLKRLEKLEESSDLEYIFPDIPRSEKINLMQPLKEVDNLLIDLRYKYQEKDKAIQSTLFKRQILVESLKKEIFAFLQAKKIIAENNLKLATKPKEVFIKYKELIREAKRDEETLVLLESSLRNIELDIAKAAPPWELITVPTLKNYPVAPSKRKIALTGLLIGLFGSYIYSFYREEKSGFLYDENELYEFLNTPILARISKDQINDIYLKALIKQKKLNNLNIICIGNIDKDKLNLIEESLKSAFKDLDIKIMSDILNLDKKHLNIALVTLNSVEKNKVHDFRNILKISEISLAGIYLIK